MRVLRVLTSSELTCGCLVGLYELYSGDVVTIVDAPSHACADHHAGQPIDEVIDAAEHAGPSSSHD